jgi:hypothetical protein
MKRLNLALIGLGNIVDAHLSAIRSYPSLFYLKGAYDKNYDKASVLPGVNFYENIEELLKDDLDFVVISTRSEQRYELSKLMLKNKIAVVGEKPFVQSLTQLNEIVALAEKASLPIYGAYHSRFTTTHMPIREDLMITKEETVHKRYGRLLNIELNRFDPYIMEGKVLEQLTPESSSALDSWPNIISELDLYVNSFKVRSVKNLGKQFMPEYRDVKTEIQGDIPGGKFIGRTDWTKGVNSKFNILEFEHKHIQIEHTKKQIFEKDPDQDSWDLTLDLSHVGERLEAEYIRLYLEIYDVMNQVKKPNIDLLTRLTAEIESMYKQL